MPKNHHCSNINYLFLHFGVLDDSLDGDKVRFQVSVAANEDVENGGNVQRVADRQAGYTRTEAASRDDGEDRGDEDDGVAEKLQANGQPPRGGVVEPVRLVVLIDATANFTYEALHQAVRANARGAAHRFTGEFLRVRNREKAIMRKELEIT